MYSQNNEEAIIVDLLSATSNGERTFLDIGAYDGKTFSNTLRLVELGWSGVCVEPSPSAFMKLLALHWDHPSLSLVNAAVITDAMAEDLSGLRIFYDCGGDAVSTLSLQHTVKWGRSGVQFRPFYSMPVRMSELLRQQGGAGYSFINLDVESLNLELFQEMHRLGVFASPLLRVVCVEHDSHDAVMAGVMQKYGFSVAARNPENLIFYRPVGVQ
jgi:FkbM family methyltransferase